LKQIFKSLYAETAYIALAFSADDLPHNRLADRGGVF
jgi:hypothetical protein